MVLKFHPKHLQAICTHAESAYPDECCGIMLGQITDDGKKLVEIWQAENVWSAETADLYLEAEAVLAKRRRYAIAPLAMLKAQREARDQHLDIIGIYHSHPNYPAVPSEFDRSCAWSQYSYVIVSVEQGKACELRSWSLDNAHQFQPEEMTNDS
ncbi:MAG: M67 family metallopeptidase [Chamaesiphon sp.]